MPTPTQQSLSTRKQRPEWQTEAIYLTVLYLIIECKQKLAVVSDNSTELGFIEHELADMYARGLIKIVKDDHGDSYWEATKKGDRGADSQPIGDANGIAFLGKIVEMCDHLMKFEIFGGVRLTRSLTEDECLDDDPNRCRDHVYDPRFLPPKEEDPEATDMRMAMLTFLAEQMSGELKGATLDPYRIAYLQKLASGRLKDKDFWFSLRLGTPFKEVEEIVASAYQWRDIVPGDEAMAIEVMKTLYTAGMLEQRKRDGFECANCGIPLALFEATAAEEGQELTECPNPDCRADYRPPAEQVIGYECPACKSAIYDGQRICSCGAIIDRRYKVGTIRDESVAQTEVVEETVYDPYYNTWSCGYGYYGYTPYGYYDAFDPFVDAVAFGCLCAALCY